MSYWRQYVRFVKVHDNGESHIEPVLFSYCLVSESNASIVALALGIIHSLLRTSLFSFWLCWYTGRYTKRRLHTENKGRGEGNVTCGSCKWECPQFAHPHRHPLRYSQRGTWHVTTSCTLRKHTLDGKSHRVRVRGRGDCAGEDIPPPP